MTFRGVALVGTVFLLAGCSDPVSPPAQGAIEITISKPPGEQCVSTGPPIGAPSGTDAILGTRAGTDDFRIIDGDGGNEVTCTVSSGEAGFRIIADLSTDNTNFTVNGTVPESGGPADVSVWSVNTSDTLTGSDCTIDPQFIDPGAVWAKFSCERFGRDLNVCSSSGTFIFENCRE